MLHAGPDDHDARPPTSRSRSTCPASCAATRCGARASPSPTPARDLGVAAVPGRARRRRVRHHRPEDLDVASRRSPTTCELLVRTDPDAPKHKGITWLIFPMDTPGHRDPRRSTPSSGSTEFSEVFFDEVRVPVDQPGRRRERRLARRHGDVQLRAGHRLRLRPGRDRPA